MKRKVVVAILAVAVALCGSLVLFACGTAGGTGNKPNSPNGPSAHTHTYANYIYNNDATCGEDGTETGTCTYARCTATDTRTKAGTATGRHTYTRYTYNYDATCVADGTETATCDICHDAPDIRTSVKHPATGVHQYRNGVCTICNAREPEQERIYKTVTFRANGATCSMDKGQFEVGKVMQRLPMPTMSGYRFKGWYNANGTLYDTTSVMPNSDLTLTAKWEKIVSTYSDSYVSLKPATSGVKNSNHNSFNVDQRVYVEIKSSDLNGGVDRDNNFTLRTLEGMEYSVNEGYTWTWYYDDSFTNVNGAQRFSLHYGSNLQFVTVNNSNGVTVRTYLVNIYVLHDYYINLYRTIYDTNAYTRVRVVEDEWFAENTPVATVGDFEFDKRVYYNENADEYVEFNYSTAITKDWNLYQTYIPFAMQVELNGGESDGGEIQIKPYTPYNTLPVPTKNGYDFMGWKIGDRYFANLQGYTGANYISQSDASETLTAVFEQKKYHFDSSVEKVSISNTVPVVTYADETMSEILEILYVPCNTDCALPTVTPQIDGKVFYRWSVFAKNSGAFTKQLIPFDFNVEVTEPIALIASAVPAERTGTTLPLNKDVTYSRTGTFVVYLPTASRYVLNISTAGNVRFTVNAYGTASESNYTASSASPAAVNLDYRKYVTGGAAERDIGYVTFNVTSASGAFAVSVSGATGETDGEPIAVSNEDLVVLNTQMTYDILRLDRIFDGFYDGSSLVSSNKDYVFTVTSEYKEYEVRWHLNPLLDNFEYTVTESELVITGIKDKTVTEIVVPDFVTEISASVFSGCAALTSVTIGNSMTSIESGAFRDCSSLAEIRYTGDIKSWCEIKGLDNLMSYGKSTRKLYIDNIEVAGDLVIPNSVTSIGDSAFRGCSSLTSIDIPNGVTSIGIYVFAGCSNLTSIEIPNSVTSIGYRAFYNCSSLTIYCEAASEPSGWYSDWNYSGCPVIWDCNNNDKDSTGYAYVVIDGIRYRLKDRNVEVIIQPSNLSGSITIPSSVMYKNETCSVTSIGRSAFEGCSSLKSVTIGNSVTSIGEYAFCNCSSLTSITIPNGVTSIGRSAFEGCINLTSITIPNSVTSIDSRAFEGCPIETATIPTTAISSIPKSKLKTVVVTGGASIGDSAFEGCSSLTSIEIPNSVTSIGRSAFDGCSSLTSITIPNSVTSIGDGAFYDCSSLTSIEIPNSVTSIGRSAFEGCSSLTSITIPNSVTSIGDGAFEYCSSLTSIEIPNSVTSIGSRAFYHCSNLMSIEIPNNVKSIGVYAFDGCSSLTSIEIPNSVTSIGVYAFYGCINLTSITIPNSVTRIGDGAFENCSSLTSIEIPNSVTSIGRSAFSGCSSLMSIEIPNSVTSIGWNAFYGCSSLTIYCEATSKPSGWDSDWNSSDRPVVWDYKNK